MELDEKIIKALVDNNLVERKSLIDIYNIHKANKQPLEKLVVEFGLVNRQKVLDTKAKVLEARPFPLDKDRINLEVARGIPSAMAKRYNLVCPDVTEDGRMMIAMHDPNDSFALEYVQMRTGKEIEPYVTLISDLENAWEEIYQDATKKRHPFLKRKKDEEKKAVKVIPTKLSLPGITRNTSVVMDDADKAKEVIQRATESIREKDREDCQFNEMVDTLKKEQEALHTLSRSTGYLNSAMGEEELICRILETGIRICNARGASILMLEEDKFHLYFREALGPRSQELKSIRLPLNDKSIAGWVVLNRVPLAVNNVDSDPRHNKDIDKAIEFQTESIACVPLLWGDEIMGVMELVNKESGQFNEKDLEYLGILANQAAVAIHNTTLLEQFQNFYMEVVEILIDCLESLDPINRHHALEVARLTSAIAKELNLSGDDYEVLCYAAFLHDLGMVKVNRNGQDIDQHPVYGAQMLSHIRFFQEVAPIVRHHHEKFDGTGYPDNLSGESIPLGSRILSVAEGYTEGRDNNPQIPQQEYLEDFLSKFGIDYDPGLKLAFMAATESFMQDEEPEQQIQYDIPEKI